MISLLQWQMGVEFYSNFYALLTIVMMFALTLMNFDYGSMKLAEEHMKIKDFNAPFGDGEGLLGASDQPHPPTSQKGKVIHLIFPIVSLIICCIIGMIYTGGFFDGASFVQAFSDADASVGLVYGSVVALLLTIVFFMATRVLSFKDCMNSIPEGFKSMVPAILVLTFAWTLKSMTDSLGAATYVAGIFENFADNGAIMSFIPALVFVIATFLAFATGTSWGTFGILIPIVVNVFGSNMNNELMIISISACMAGAVCGDHCSPISDTTIMASAGAQCDHIKHVSTQLPYAMTAAVVSFASYIVSGFVRNWIICLGVGIVLMIGTLFVIRNMKKN